MSTIKNYIKLTWWKIKLLFYKPPKDKDYYIYEKEE